MTHFREEQRFRQPWLMLLMAGMVSVCAWAVERSRGDTTTLVMVVGVPAVIWLWLLSMTLVTEVHAEALHIRFKMLWPEQIIPYYRIVKAESTTYNPILDYGGWGVRGIAPVKAFNVSGNRGVLLTLTDGQTLMVGSQKADQLAAALQPGIARARKA